MAVFLEAGLETAQQAQVAVALVLKDLTLKLPLRLVEMAGQAWCPASPDLP